MTKESQITNGGFQIPFSEVPFGIRASSFFRHYDLVIRCFVMIFLLYNLSASASETNSLVWRNPAGRVDADVHDLALWPLLEQIARQADWKIFVEPGAEHLASAKFENVSSGTALKMLLGDLNFALVPESNSPPQLYVFRTTMQNATRLVKTGMARHVPNELMIRVKPGTDVDALAKMLGAKITGRLDKCGIYRLQFADAAATDAAMSQLQNDSDVLGMDYNYIFDPEPEAQMVPSSPLGPISLTLNPPGSSGHVIVGLVDTPVQTLGGSLEQFLLSQISVTGDAYATGIFAGTLSAHPTLTAPQILSALQQKYGVPWK